MKPIPRSYSRLRVGMPQFTLSNLCDECGGSRAHGSNKASSKKGQARSQSEKAAAPNLRELDLDFPTTAEKKAKRKL